MADVALLGESPGHVIWIRRALVVLPVAADAGSIGQVVVAIDMAIAALQFQVPSRQGKAALGMIECSGLPRGGAVAHGAVRRKTRRCVVRVRCPLVVLHVAAHARSARQVVIAVDVAVGALQPGVRAADGETYSRVIEARGLPSGCGVAVLAGLWKPEREVIRIRGFAEIRHVTRHTVGRRPLVLATRMATRAIEGGVRAGEGVACKVQMIKASAEPSGDGMTLFASTREAGCDVVGC